MILADVEIKKLVEEQGMIEGFIDHQVKEIDGKKAISYGLSSHGYDVRLADTLKIFRGREGEVFDPKNPKDPHFMLVKGRDVIEVPAYSHVLGYSVERFKIPRNIMCLVEGKSTYARSGLFCNVTPLEAGWEGQITLEFFNSLSVPVKMYLNEGCCQVLFFNGEHCEVSYADRGGKYQGQMGITLSKV